MPDQYGIAEVISVRSGRRVHVRVMVTSALDSALPGVDALGRILQSCAQPPELVLLDVMWTLDDGTARILFYQWNPSESGAPVEGEGIILAPESLAISAFRVTHPAWEATGHGTDVGFMSSGASPAALTSYVEDPAAAPLWMHEPIVFLE